MSEDIRKRQDACSTVYCKSRYRQQKSRPVERHIQVFQAHCAIVDSGIRRISGPEPADFDDRGYCCLTGACAHRHAGGTGKGFH